jgi:hypothetical protein
MAWLPYYFDFGVFSLLFVKIDYAYDHENITKHERLPKPKTRLRFGLSAASLVSALYFNLPSKVVICLSCLPSGDLRYDRIMI